MMSDEKDIRWVGSAYDDLLALPDDPRRSAGFQLGMAATPYEILRFIGRGTSLRDYQRLRAALDRLQSTSVATSLRQSDARRLHRFSWINEWKERADREDHPPGIELILPDWFYAGVLEQSLVLTIDASYFRLTGGIERWLYRLVRKHGGWQREGWRFDFPQLYQKSGSLARFSDFAVDLRRIVARQPLPGYTLAILRPAHGAEVLSFRTVSSTAPLRLGGSFDADAVPVNKL
jgi:plasmid replication initiation protein